MAKRLEKARVLVPAAIGMAALAASAAPRQADACSVVGHYIQPTNYELVQTSPAIVIGRAESESTGNRRDQYIHLRVTSVLKGTAVKKGSVVKSRGSTQSDFGPAAPFDFSKARPGATRGSCTAYDYQLGRDYLLLLDQYGGKWSVRGTPFTRVNEEVTPGDAWHTAVRAYIRIGALSDSKARVIALRSLQKKGEAKGASKTSKAIAADIRSHMARPTPFKRFAELEPMFRSARTKGERDQVLVAIGTGHDAAAKAFMIAQIDRLTAGKSTVSERAALLAFGKYFEKVPSDAAIDKLGSLYVALGSGKKQARWPIMWLLIKRAGTAHEQLMMRVIGSADSEETGRLAAWFVRHPSEAARKLLLSRLGTDYNNKYEIAHALAGMGDKSVVAWATTQISKPSKDPWIAVYIIAKSPLPSADRLARKIIRQGGTNLTSLIQAYAEANHRFVDRRLADIGKRKLTTEQRKWLSRSVAQRKKSSAP